MGRKPPGVVQRAAIILMLLIAALWLALVSVLFGEWIAAGTRMWAVSFDLGKGLSGATAQADAMHARQMWGQRLAQAILAGPVAFALLSMITRRRWLIWFCFILVGAAAAGAVLIDAR